jgi:hypothetical protein
MKLDLQGSAFCPERERTACRGDGLLASGATEAHCDLAYRTGGRPAIDVRVWHEAADLECPFTVSIGGKADIIRSL